MANNYAQVQKGFRILLFALSDYVCKELKQEYGANWWTIGVMDVLYDDQKQNLPQSGDWTKLVDSLDILNCLTLFDVHWKNVFRKKLSIDHRTWAIELKGVRNKLAHIGSEDIKADDAWRALDTMSRLCDQIDPDSTEEIRQILRTSRYGTADGSANVKRTRPPAHEIAAAHKKRKDSGILKDVPVNGLPSWRDVIEPHPDVAQGRYRNAEFAADLAQVSRGEGSLEYRDPVEFFSRTYVTEGMTGLLVQALRRLCGKDGEPVIQLKTAFGGGKTHSMLALYHMMRRRVSLDAIPNMKPVIERADVASLPKANVAVLVGTALDPARTKRPTNMPGITINTIWGEMAAQLAESSGNWKIYDYIKEADKKAVSPGSEALKNLFDAAAPCLILMDELVSYAKRIHGVSGLPAGSFDNFISFIQEITEAARASKNSLVVASIPESEIEIGGEAGKIALETIEHTFGRMESIWKPVAANKGFEVVRRRLFLDCKNPNGRDVVCAKFSRFYNENQSDFPTEAREVEYLERMKSCYPIHPEVFDRLYVDWATLDKFQRTRGVLRLMAAVIHELWMGNDAGLMIMPGSIPLDVPNIRDELTRHLDEGWNALVDREVDGRNSIPFQKDQTNPRYGVKLAARRVARTVMLGSAPTVRDQNVRGIESSRIRLGVVQPGESIANFNDALNTLSSSLAYFYTNPSGDRYWYDTRPTLRKTVDDRATQVSHFDVEHEIETRLKNKLRKEQPLSGIHICPASTLDVTDEQTARLVILCPTETYKSGNPDCAGQKAVTDIFNNRGTNPRIYRNMIAFVAPDQDLTASLNNAVQLYRAWLSINNDKDSLNLDARQIRETKDMLRRFDETVESRIKEAYCWLLVPNIDKSGDMKTIEWDATRISGGTDGIVTKAVKKMLQDEAIISLWAPVLLLMELDNLLWKETDSIPIKKLWEQLCTYCYLPRLADENVLNEAIRAGVNGSEYFAVASGFDGTRYIDLKFNRHISIVEKSGLIVKVDVAQKQFAEEAEKRQAEADVAAARNNCGTSAITAASANETDYTYSQPVAQCDTGGTPAHSGGNNPAASKNGRFFMSADLDVTRIYKDVKNYVEEIIQHLTSVDGAKVKVSIKVDAESVDGFSQQTVRTISENCRTLNVRASGFEE